ncbi:hypothetical protein [Trinickia violacea]|nr:hypothetical protein [Trinickia violacea]
MKQKGAPLFPNSSHTMEAKRRRSLSPAEKKVQRSADSLNFAEPLKP